MEAIPEVLLDDGRFKEILHESSRDADLVFLGMAEPRDPESFTRYYRRLKSWIAPLPTVVLVLASPDTPSGRSWSSRT